MRSVLTIAGSDCSGGAGIQADIKTITAHRLYASSVVTALTAQNTTGVYAVEPVECSMVSKQLECIFTDIFPDAVKIGMLADARIVETVADSLAFYRPKNIVADTVLASTSGSRLLDGRAESVFMERLLPLADVITPNLPEAEALACMEVQTEEQMLAAAQKIFRQLGSRTAVLVKGGHLKGKTARDLLYYSDGHGGGIERWYGVQHIDNKNTHGTGCTLSSAIAANLAAGFSLPESVERAKAYITGAIGAKMSLGRGNGPLNHMYAYMDGGENG